MKRIEFKPAATATAQDRAGPAAVAGVAVMDEPASPSHALVICAGGVVPDHGHSSLQRSAAFVAQLLAAKADLPQTRERRRADPQDAVHLYASGMAPAPCAQGKLVARAL